jgi:hypothetical protein
MTLNSRLMTSAVCALAFAGLAGLARGSSIPLVNPTFSSPAQGSFVAAGGSFLGWTTGGNAGVLNYTANSGSPTTEAPYWPTVPAGTTFAYSNLDDIKQITTSPLGVIEPGFIYTLQVGAGQGIGVGGPTSNVISLIAADGTVLSTATTANSIGSFTTETLTYTAPLSGAVLGQQIGVVLGTGGIQSNFDNVVLTAVPEPGALGLLGLGALGLAWTLRKRCASQSCR